MNNKISNGMIKFLKKNLCKIILIVFILALPVLSLAQVTGDAPVSSDVKIVNPLGPETETITDLIEKVLKGAVKIGMPIIVLAIIYCGFLFVSAQGKPESIKKAKDALLYTLIGAAILLGSWGIAQLITSTVNAL